MLLIRNEIMESLSLLVLRGYTTEG